METLDKVKIMQAFDIGKDLYQKAKSAPESSWRIVKNPSWNWDKNVYKIKPSTDSIIVNMFKDTDMVPFLTSFQMKYSTKTDTPMIFFTQKFRQHLLSNMDEATKAIFILVPADEYTKNLMQGYKKTKEDYEVSNTN